MERKKNYKGKRPKTEWPMLLAFVGWFIAAHLLAEVVCV
jgi:hypothetical protein